MTKGAKLRIAWVSSHVQGETLSSYTSRHLLPLLKEQFVIEVFDENGREDHFDIPHYHFLRLKERDRAAPFDLIFYQVEDDLTARFLRIAVAHIQGVVWFHDLYFRDHGPEPILNSAWNSFLSHFHDRTSGWPDREAEHLQELPLARREASLAAIPIFSNPRDRDEYMRQVGSGVAQQYWKNLQQPSYTIPLPVLEPTPRGIDTSHPFTVGIVGSPQLEHRAQKFLPVLKQLHLQAIWLLPPEGVVRAKELLKEFSVEEQVELKVGRTPELWNEIAPHIDVALHFSFSVYGQLGPYLGISLRHGLPCCVTRFASAEYLPSELVYQIEPGIHEGVELQFVLQDLQQRGFQKQKEATLFAEENYASRQVAAELSLLFHGIVKLPGYQSFRNDWHQFQKEANQSLFNEVQDLGRSSTWGGDQVQRLFEDAYRELGWSEDL